QWIIVQLHELGETYIELLRTLKPNFPVVHCPRSHEYFQHSPFEFQRLRELGFNICLGTDSLASNENLSLFAEMRAFLNKQPHVSPQEALAMITRNPAHALCQDGALG